MLPCKIKMQKKWQNFFQLVRGAKRQHLACQAAVLTIRLCASPEIATVKTACNWDGGDTIAQLVTLTRGRNSRSITLA